MSSFGRRRPSVKVYLNIYDLAPSNDVLHPIGFGVYHTGVEIMGSEYTFASEAGIFTHTPRDAPQARFREQIEMGIFEGGQNEIKSITSTLTDEKYGPDEYDVLRNNCNHFSNAFCIKLVNRRIPAYINRLADIGVCCSCLIPKQMLQQQSQVKNDETNSFLVRGGNNAVQNNNNTINVFGGTGSKLGGGSSGSTTTTISGSSSSYKNSTSDTLNDRREKARMAALARLERQQQQQNDSDKSL